ncbi:putative Dna polymerase lambdalike protein, partial [Globisporangium splendens]
MQICVFEWLVRIRLPFSQQRQPEQVEAEVWARQLSSQAEPIRSEPDLADGGLFSSKEGAEKSHLWQNFDQLQELNWCDPSAAEKRSYAKPTPPLQRPIDTQRQREKHAAVPRESGNVQLLPGALLHAGDRGDDHQLLILSVALGSLFRTATFSTLCFFDSQNADLPPSPGGGGVLGGGGNPHSYKYGWLIGPDDGASGSGESDADGAKKELDFYNKVVAVLFNLPDFLFVSSYLLLVLVWAEAFQSSRRHWFSASDFRRRWMIFYLIFNGLLYLMQLLLYAALFLYDKNGIFKDEKQDRLNLIPEMIFLVVAATDLFLPLIILTTWVYLTLSLSGFPSKSLSARFRLKRVGRLAMAWSVGRILYSVMTVLTFTKADFEHRKHVLELHLETNPVPFQPSPALTQFIQGDKRRNVTAKSAKQQKQKTRNTEYLERKVHMSGPILESEIRQHYELENAQSCAKWKRFHLQETELMRELSQKIERDAQLLYKRLKICYEPPRSSSPSEAELFDPSAFQDKLHSGGGSDAARNQKESDMEPILAANQDEEQQGATDWIQQERFNIQEAFTNQTKKIHSDFQVFMDQLDADYVAQRQKLINGVYSNGDATIGEQQPQRSAAVSRHEVDKHFKSNTKRHMLAHTAPVVGMSSDIVPQGSRVAQQRHNPSDVSDVQQRLDHLEARHKAMAEHAEIRRKDAMVWIGRQCAHLFSQLDSKETETKFVSMIVQQHQHTLQSLLARIQPLPASLENKTKNPDIWIFAVELVLHIAVLVLQHKVHHEHFVNCKEVSGIIRLFHCRDSFRSLELIYLEFIPAPHTILRADGQASFVTWKIPTFCKPKDTRRSS